MSESKHTPGPWKYAPQGDSDGFTVGTDHFVVAGDVELACPPNEADARLIAAAPELLLELELLAEGLDEAAAQLHGNEWGETCAAWARQARGVIRKAKGD